MAYPKAVLYSLLAQHQEYEVHPYGQHHLITFAICIMVCGSALPKACHLHSSSVSCAPPCLDIQVFRFLFLRVFYQSILRKATLFSFQLLLPRRQHGKNLPPASWRCSCRRHVNSRKESTQKNAKSTQKCACKRLTQENCIKIVRIMN